jgi:hypothetical protein
MELERESSFSITMQTGDVTDPLATLDVIRPDEDLLDGVRGREPADALVSILLARNVRSSHLPDSVRSAVVERVAQAVENAEPIRIVNSFGGFKAWRVRSAPHVEWSEVFHLAYFSRWLVNVATIYEPGVKLEYSGQSLVATLVNNYRTSDVACYTLEFERLVEQFDHCVPANFQITVRDLETFYDATKVREAVTDPDAGGSETQDFDGATLAHARRNFVFDGERDLSSSSPAEREALLRRSVTALQRWTEFDRLHRARYFSEVIGVTNGPGHPELYHVRSLAGSDKNFWMTEGVLLDSNHECRPAILMPDDARLERSVNRRVESVFQSASPALSEIREICERKGV